MNKSIDKFKEISIIGRLAYAALCLENVFDMRDQLNNVYVQYILKNIWVFVSSDNLDHWHSNMEKLLPEYILTIDFESKELDIESKEYMKGLRELYSILPIHLLKMIEYTTWIGISNLYEDTGEYSEQSLAYLSLVLEISEKNGIVLPAFEAIKFSKFTEFHGWGNSVESPECFNSKLFIS